MTTELYKTFVPFPTSGETHLTGLGGHTLPCGCTRTCGRARVAQAALVRVLHAFIIPTPTHGEHRMFRYTRNLFLCYLKT